MIPIIKPWLGEAEADAAAAAVRSGWVAQGPRVAAFEAQFCAQTGAAHAIAVSSCTTALHLALIGAGVRAGDAVIVPSLSFIATTNAVAYVGAAPVFADVDPGAPNVTVRTLEAALTPACTAVIIAHQVGMPAELAAIAAWCADHNLTLIEDAACAIGSTLDGRLIGAHSPFVAFSFHPRKVLTTGEGGMLTVRDPVVADRLRKLRQHAMSVSAVARHEATGVVLPTFQEVGYNYRMTDIQAAIGLVQLGKLDAIIARRRALAASYQAALADLAKAGALLLPVDPPWGRSNYQTFVIRLESGGQSRRDAVLAALIDDGIGAGPGIMAAHMQPAWSALARGPLPQTERWAASSIALPLYHTMTQQDQADVITALRAALVATP